MEKTIKIIKELQKEGLIKKYAVGGGIATIFYVEPILTYDLDIFFIPLSEGVLTEEQKELITLSPIYDWFRKKGYKSDKEHIIIEGVPVQFIPVYNELIKDAIEDAVEVKYKNTMIIILKAEYLLAIMLQTFRPKDKERIIKLIDETKIDNIFLTNILQKHKLKEKFDKFKRIYYGK